MMSGMPIARQLVGRAADLAEYFTDDNVTDILINGTHSLYVERSGLLTPVTNPFGDRAALLDFIERMVVPIGRRIDAAHPYLDGRMADGSRFHIILPPIAPSGPIISIRKLKSPGEKLLPFADPKQSDWLASLVRDRKNLLIAGGTGAGKTTLLAWLLDKVGPEERIAIVESSAEIRLAHPHAVHLEGRPASPDGKGEVTLRELIRNALRMRPDRIVVGECRGEEVFDMLQAMNTGHPGSMGTLHANHALDGLKRLETLMLLAGSNLPLRAAREWIASAIDYVVFLRRRRVEEVLAIHGLEGEVFRISPRVKSGAFLRS